MAEKRISGWFVLSAVFIVLVFGLFFTFTERKSWPEHRIELSPMDMRLAPPVSTLWCEAVALHSDHSFVAYQVNQDTRISSKRMSLQRVYMQLKLGTRLSTNSIKLKYFLLPSSVIDIVTCSSAIGAKLFVFKGDLDVPKCLQSIVRGQEDSKSSGYDSDEDSTEEIEDLEFDYESPDSAGNAMEYKKYCSHLLAYQPVSLGHAADTFSMECSPQTLTSPFRTNVTSADSYVIALWNTNRVVTNRVKLEILLDRTRYSIHTSGGPFDLCSLSSSCVIGLGFATNDRVLVSIPEEPNAGRSNFVIRTRCKPRLAVFAILSVFLPLLLFLTVTFIIRADVDVCRRRRTTTNRQLINHQRIFVPLLADQNPSAVAQPRTEPAGEFDELPPPYSSLYDTPPSYDSVKKDEEKALSTS